jgi:hypothetical protein
VKCAAALCLLTVVSIASAASGAASATSRPATTVSATGSVGALKVDRSRPAEIRRLAGRPSFQGQGRTALGPAFEALGYGCSRRWADTKGINPGGRRLTHVWCRTVYFVSLGTHTLASFWTDSPTFRTVNGSHPGMPQRIADRLERQHAYVHALTGIGYSAPSADLFIESIGCKSARPGGDPERTPCLGGHVRSLIVEGHHPVGLLRDLFPSWNR